MRRRLFFGALYFCEGAPIGWLWWALPSQLRRRGVDVDEITTLTALLAWPWVLKFLWAPLVDVLQGPRFGLRGWILCAQLGMLATLVPLIGLDPARHLDVALGLLVAHACFAATQDVAIDALAIRSVPPAEHGSLNGAMQAGYLLGRVLFSAGVLALAARGHDAVAVPLLLATLAATSVLVVLHRPGPAHAPRRPRARRRRRLARALLASRRVRRLAAFALLGGAGLEGAGALSGSWLVDRGFDDAGVALFRLISAAAMVAGALLGGRAADRSGPRVATRRALLAVAALVALLVAVDAAWAPTPAAAVYALAYGAIGALTAASYALFMGSSRGALAATTFSAFMGLTNACESWSSAAAGAVQVRLGYGAALLVLAAASLPALGALRRR